MMMSDRLVDSPSGHRLHRHLSWVFNGRDEFAEVAATDRIVFSEAHA